MCLVPEVGAIASWVTALLAYSTYLHLIVDQLDVLPPLQAGGKMIPESYKGCGCWRDMTSAALSAGTDGVGANHNPALMSMIKSPRVVSPLPLALLRAA